MKQGGFDAAFLAVGAHIGKRTMIPAGDASHIVDAISVLRSMEGRPADAGPQGRGVQRRQYRDRRRAHGQAHGRGAIIVYRRTREKAPAHDFEIEEALQEGVMIKWLSTIKQAGGARSPSRRWRWTKGVLSRPASLKTGGRFGGAGAGTGRRSVPARRRAGT